MALIKCRECNKDVAKSATKCPHCGGDPRPMATRVATIIFYVVTIPVLLFLLWQLLLLWGCSNTETVASSPGLDATVADADGSDSKDGPSDGTNEDGNPESGTTPESGNDTGSDTADTIPDGEPDAPKDSDVEAGDDAAVDAGPEAEAPDDAPDAASDAPQEAGTDPCAPPSPGGPVSGGVDCSGLCQTLPDGYGREDRSATAQRRVGKLGS